MVCRAGKVFKPINLPCEKSRDDKGAYTEHLCFECWARKEVSPSPEGFLQGQKSKSKWRTMCLEDASLYDTNAWEFPLGTCADALGGLEEQRLVSPEWCRLENGILYSD